MSQYSRVVAITGANRGLGLEFVKQLSEVKDTLVIAYSRDPKAASLVDLKKDNVKIIKLDASDSKQIETAAKETSEITKSIDVLINNAGIAGNPIKLTDANPDLDAILNVHNVNVLGPIRVTSALLPLVREGKEKKIVYISSGMGSVSKVASNNMPVHAAYNMSKAGLNMAVAVTSRELKDEGIIVYMQCPGHVETDMGGPSAILQPPESISNMLAKIESVTIKDTGSFVGVRGEAGSAKVIPEDF